MAEDTDDSEGDRDEAPSVTSGHHDPWAPDADVSFERVPPTPFAPITARDREPPSPDRARPSDPLGVEHSPRAGEVRFEHDPSETTAPGTRGLRPVMFALAAALVVGLGAAIVLGDDDPPPPETEQAELDPSRDELSANGVGDDESSSDTGDDIVLGVGDVPLGIGEGACSSRRLPADVEERWTTELGVDVVPVGAPAAGDDVVVVPVSTGRMDDPVASIRLLAFDLVDGEEAWRTDVGAAGAWRVVDVFSGVAIVERRSPETEAALYIGLDERSGEELWRLPVGQASRLLADRTTGLVVVFEEPGDAGDGDGDRDGDGGAAIAYDIATLDRVAGGPGRFVGIDDAGGVVLDRGGTIISSTRSGSGSADESVLARVNRNVTTFAVVGSMLLTAGPNSASLTVIEPTPGGGLQTQRLELVGSAGIEPPVEITRMEPIGGTSVLVEGDGAVHGGNISGDTLELRWRKRGDLVWISPSDRGGIAFVGGGRAIVDELVDASTGRTVAEVPRPPNIGAHANGVLVTEADGSNEEPLVTAFGLDGRERWTLTGAIRPTVGDRVVVAQTFENQPSTDGGTPAIRYTAYGAIPDGPPRCGSVMQEW